MPALAVTILPSRRDNYIYALHNAAGEFVIVDPGEATPALTFLQANKLTLKAIVITHHHYDHIDGTPEILAYHPVPVYGFAGDAYRIPFLSHPLHDGETVTLLGEPASVRHIPGHTLGHIFYHLPQANMAFVGDTLFSMGCGRLFEGDAASMYSSLQMIARLPKTTQLYCGHEYTLANAAFAQAAEPSNNLISERISKLTQLRKIGTPSLPTALDDELRSNPFLRCNSIEIRQFVEMSDSAGEIDVFAALRSKKDTWSA
jgi:hydroxyacylglutathione hydrolase